LTSGAAAEVKSATSIGFEMVSTVRVTTPPVETYFVLSRVGQWWNPEHTYSGFGANLTLLPKAGGCFCESVPKTGATIEHGRVVHAQPNVLLRLQAALGPLQAEGVTGTLTWELKEVPGGTLITQTYVVGGYIRGGAQRMAPMVDKVLSDQLSRLASRLANGPGQGSAAPPKAP
jgi:uncharacterized protein YndB with AHSA1/START domain